ncbi:hypothetical protein [Streptomyces parvulus]|uniref:hypothetical protein n=1 Tax=Streptomyces parvulus TaxID=146923 RepID=UPI00372093F5
MLNDSVGSVATHAPSRSIRTGVPCRFTDHVPSGNAHVSEDSVRAESSSYGCLEAAACSSAWSSSLFEPSATGSASVAATGMDGAADAVGMLRAEGTAMAVASEMARKRLCQEQREACLPRGEITTPPFQT